MNKLKTPFKCRWINGTGTIYTVEDYDCSRYYITWEKDYEEIDIIYSKNEFMKEFDKGLIEILNDESTYSNKCDSEETIESESSISTQSQWTASHYDNYYQLTPKDIESGKIKIDAYFVNKIWKLNQKDDTGGLFHSLKTIARFGDKNSIERELKALHAQTKRMAELYGVEL